VKGENAKTRRERDTRRHCRTSDKGQERKIRVKSRDLMRGQNKKKKRIARMKQNVFMLKGIKRPQTGNGPLQKGQRGKPDQKKGKKE